MNQKIKFDDNHIWFCAAKHKDWNCNLIEQRVLGKTNMLGYKQIMYKLKAIAYHFGFFSSYLSGQLWRFFYAQAWLETKLSLNFSYD